MADTQETPSFLMICSWPTPDLSSIKGEPKCPGRNNYLLSGFDSHGLWIYFCFQKGFNPNCAFLGIEENSNDLRFGDDLKLRVSGFEEGINESMGNTLAFPCRWVNPTG